jgi:hypothetical protein
LQRGPDLQQRFFGLTRLNSGIDETRLPPIRPP